MPIASDILKRERKGFQQNLTPQPGLERAALSQGQIPMHPLLQKIMKQFGLMNLLRNRSNDQMVSGQV